MSRPSDLTQELTLQIRAYVLDGFNYNKIQETLEISSNTWDAWVYKDYKDFRKNLNSWKKERLLKKSEKLSEEILDMEHNKEGMPLPDILRIKQKESEFVRSTLGKDEGYSERVENTGKDGQPLQIIIPKAVADTFNIDDNSNSETRGNNTE